MQACGGGWGEEGVYGGGYGCVIKSTRLIATQTKYYHKHQKQGFEVSPFNTMPDYNFG